MAYGRQPDRGDREDRRDRARRPRRKRCQFCTARTEIIIDYKNASLMRGYLDDRGRIRKARQAGSCRRHQSRMASAVKRAREIALIPYVLHEPESTEARGGRGRGRGRGR